MLPPLLLEKLHRHRAPHSSPAAPEIAIRVELPHERCGSLVDECFELDVVDEGEGEVEDIPRFRADGGEEAVEEDRVKYAFVPIHSLAFISFSTWRGWEWLLGIHTANYILDTTRISKDLDDVLWRSSLIHCSILQHLFWCDSVCR